MNVLLAEKLLRKVMNWTPAEYSHFGGEMQAMASYKYDEYQQFTPGMRFTESLARWLDQFPQNKRAAAFEFVRAHLIFISDDEMNHLVSICYLDFVRPVLMRITGSLLGLGDHKVNKIRQSTEFRRSERATLFLGLSDGARTDVLRRTNPHLSNEQVRNTHELSEGRINSLLKDLAADTAALGGAPSTAFETVVLLDDFSGSGLTYARKDESGKLSGKLGKFVGSLMDSGAPESRLIGSSFTLIVVLYMATAKAEKNLRSALEELSRQHNFKFEVVVTQRIPESVQVDSASIGDMAELIDEFYDPAVETDATKVGGTDLRYGFNGCGLNLVLAHNSPNNSVGLLWAETKLVRALFPRVTRHKDFV